MTWERDSAFSCVGLDGLKGEFSRPDPDFCFWVLVVRDFSPVA